MKLDRYAMNLISYKSGSHSTSLFRLGPLGAVCNVYKKRMSTQFMIQFLTVTLTTAGVSQS